MEDKVYKVIMEKMNRFQIIFLCMLFVLGAYGISDFLEDNFGIKIWEETILLLFIGILLLGVVKFGRIFPSTEIQEVLFQKDKVVFRRGKRESEIFYADITEVQKIMVINRYHVEKGYYRVKIKMKMRSYTMYSGEDSNKQLDFSQTDINKVYLEFQSRGIKCC